MAMPTIEIDVPEGWPYESIERVCEDHDATHLELLLAGVDAVATPDAASGEKPPREARRRRRQRTPPTSSASGEPVRRTQRCG